MNANHNNLWRDGLICAFEFHQARRKSTKYHTRSLLQCQGGDSLYTLTYHKLLTLSVFNCLMGFLLWTILTNCEQCSSCCSCGGDRKKHEFREEEEEEHSRSYWRPIGWDRLSELVQTVKVDGDWSAQNVDGEATVAELAAPYWERPLAGPTWWCHVDASHRGVALWLREAQWLHPAVSVALRDESKLISERMKHIFYEVK